MNYDKYPDIKVIILYYINNGVIFPLLNPAKIYQFNS